MARTIADVLTVEDHGRVRLLTLNRPDRLNAFDTALWDALRDGLDEARSDDGVAVTVITGAGRAFSAGADVESLAGGAPPAGSGYPGFMPILEAFDKPLLAAVNGVGVGIGMTLLAHCDVVLMARSARLRTPFAPLGVTAEGASSLLLAERMGWQEAAVALFSGRWCDSETAVNTGLAWKVCDDEAVVDETLALAAEMAAWPIPSLVETKRLMLASRGDAVRDAWQAELGAFGRLVGTPANIEAVTAFMEKRAPDFSQIEGA